MSTLIAGQAELSTWPTSFLVTTGKSPTFSCVVLTTSHVTFGAFAGTRPYTSRSKCSTISGRRSFHHISADVTCSPSSVTSGSGSVGYGFAFASS